MPNQPRVGVGAQRAVLSLQAAPYREVDFAPARQMLVGMKFFVMKNLASLEWTSGFGQSHDCTYSGSGIKPPGYEGTWSVVTNILVGGVSLYFQEVTEGAMPCGAY